MSMGSFIARFGAFFGLLILFIFLSVSSKVFLTPDNLSNIARQATVNAFLAVGLLLAILTAGIDLSVGSVLALAMCTLALMAIRWHVNPFLAILACLAAGTFVGWINGLLLTRLQVDLFGRCGLGGGARAGNGRRSALGVRCHRSDRFGDRLGRVRRGLGSALDVFRLVLFALADKAFDLALDRIGFARG